MPGNGVGEPDEFGLSVGAGLGEKAQEMRLCRTTPHAQFARGLRQRHSRHEKRQYAGLGNGALGRINRSVAGNALVFDWDQDGGFTGTGQFVLSNDGSAFSGSYRSDPSPALRPDLLTGTWQGQRRQKTSRP